MSDVRKFPDKNVMATLELPEVRGIEVTMWFNDVGLIMNDNGLQIATMGEIQSKVITIDDMEDMLKMWVDDDV
jgi:hypothetical protein